MIMTTITTTELPGKKAGGGVKSIGDKLPQGLHTKQLQRELYPQAIVSSTTLLQSHEKKEPFLFSILLSILGRKISIARPLVTHDLTSMGTKKSGFISINDFVCSTIQEIKQ